MSYLCTKIPKVPGFVRNVLKVYFFRRPVMKNMSKINIRQSYPTKIAIRISSRIPLPSAIDKKIPEEPVVLNISHRRGNMLLQLESIRIHQVFHCHLLLTHKNTKSAWLCKKYPQSIFFNIQLRKTCQKQGLKGEAVCFFNCSYSQNSSRIPLPSAIDKKKNRVDDFQ